MPSLLTLSLSRYIYIYIYICVCMYVCVCIYIYIHTYTHSYSSSTLHTACFGLFVMAILTCIKLQNTLKKDNFNPNFQKNKTLLFSVKMGFMK